jgi:hypothetical protein
MRIDTVGLTVVVVLGMLISPAGAVTLNVNTPMDDYDMVPGDGSCISGTIGMCTLRAAIQEAGAVAGDDIINLPAGEFILTIPGLNENSGATGDLDVIGNLSIYGEGAEFTIVDAAGLDRVFDLQSGVLELVGLTVTGGRETSTGSYLGGGIRAGGSLLSIGGCHLTNNVANQGGAIFSSTATAVQIMDSLIEGNATELSGFTNPWGAAIRSEGALTLESSTVTGNAGNTTSQ